MNSSNNKLWCLNLGSGKIDEDRYINYIKTVHVDRSYVYGTTPISVVVAEFADFVPKQYLCQSNIFDFIDSFPYTFNVVFAERIFEHMDYVSGEIGRLLEGINVLTTKDAELTIVVPNAILLSKMLVDYENRIGLTDDCGTPIDPHVKDLNTKLIINTEFNNGKFDPHLSIWTPRLAREYIESEGTWKVAEIEKQIRFAGRDIYMRIFCTKT